MSPDWFFDAVAADEADGIEIVQVPCQTYGSVAVSESVDEPRDLEVRDRVSISGSADG
jgi:hypothetical protein